jgi:hypothetical protein
LGEKRLRLVGDKGRKTKSRRVCEMDDVGEERERGTSVVERGSLSWRRRSKSVSMRGKKKIYHD